MKPAVLAGLLTALASPALAAERCPDGSVRNARTSCPPPARKFEPYDPDRLKGGSRPGSIDLGGGTEVRVGGRARYERGYQR